MATVKDGSANGLYIDQSNVSTDTVDPNIALLTTISNQLAEELTVKNIAEVLEEAQDSNRNARIGRRHLEHITDEVYNHDDTT